MMINENVLMGLRTLGLTSKEAAALLAIVARGSASAREVSREIGVHYPVVYRLLASLERKGWIEGSQDRPKLYRARDIAAAAEEAAQEMVKKVHDGARTVKRELREIAVSEEDRKRGGTWIIKGWRDTLRKVRELAGKTERCVFIVGKEPIEEKELDELLKSLSRTKGYLNLYLVADSNYKRLRELYPEVNYQITLSKFKADPTRFLTLFIIFDEREALFINAYYREGRLAREKVYTTWERDPGLIDILMEGNNLKLKEWAAGL
jgi:sugar-specific transcriptional regulator TrmB